MRNANAVSRYVPGLAVPDDALLVQAHGGHLFAVGREAGARHEARVLRQALLEPVGQHHARTREKTMNDINDEPLLWANT